MKKCSECNGEMKELVNKTPEGIEYTYFKCQKCGEEILNMNQLHNVAEKYRGPMWKRNHIGEWELENPIE